MNNATAHYTDSRLDLQRLKTHLLACSGANLAGLVSLISNNRRQHVSDSTEPQCALKTGRKHISTTVYTCMTMKYTEAVIKVGLQYCYIRSLPCSLNKKLSYRLETQRQQCISL